MVHDVSELDLETRACWQGLSWLRYACWKAWNTTSPPKEVGRNGMSLDSYWEKQYRALPRTTKHLLEYWGQYYKAGDKIYIRSCWKKGGGRLYLAKVGGDDDTRRIGAEC